MKVKELIEKLSKCNPEAEAVACPNLDELGGHKYYLPLNFCQDYTQFGGERMEGSDSPVVVIANSSRTR